MTRLFILGFLRLVFVAFVSSTTINSVENLPKELESVWFGISL